MTTHHFTIETTDYKGYLDSNLNANGRIELGDDNKDIKSKGLMVLFKHRDKLEGKLHVLEVWNNQDDEPLLIYPFSIDDSKDLKKNRYNEDLFILEMRCKDDKVHEYTLKTGCLIGFISATFTDETSGNDYQFNIYIHSRFDWKKSNPTIHYDGTDEKWEDKETASLGKDFFLHYMLQKVLNINVVREPSFGEDNSNLELLLYFFPAMLRRAMKQGLYRRYERREYNDARVRGPIDISRHIAKNIPFCGKIAYSTTEFDYDNSITQLVRHTIEYIAHHDWASDLLRQSDETWGDVRLIRELTADGYDPNARQRIIQSNLRLISHPFYTEWRPLQHLCLAILRYDDLRHDRANDEDRIHGLLFDGPWLWESYLWAVFQENNLGFKHPDNTTGEDAICLFQRENKKDSEIEITEGDARSKKYPDFYKPKGDKNSQIAIEIWDAKFKGYKLDKSMKRKDIHQIITYMHIQQDLSNKKVPSAGVVFPLVDTESGCRELGTLMGGGIIYKWGLQVENSSKYTNFDDYKSKMKINEGVFIASKRFDTV